MVEQFGLDYDSLVSLRPDVIAVRMPGYGLQGPWRDYVGWALNFEQTAGMSAVTGYPDGPPCNPQGPADPIVGVHAGVALLAALEHRNRTGEGQLIEIAQIEVAAAVTAEPVIEYSMNGVVRRARRQPPARVSAGRLPDRGRRVGGAGACPTMVRSTMTYSTRWSPAGPARRLPEIIVENLRAQGIPAESVVAGDQMYDIPQLDARGYYEEFEHPVTGPHRYPGWPFRITPGPVRHHRTAPPTLGQHNDEVLRGLGLSGGPGGRVCGPSGSSASGC